MLDKLDEFDELAKLYCKLDELAKLSSMSWISCTVSLKFGKFDELAKLM